MDEGKSVSNMFKSKQQNWQTPKDFYDKLNEEFNFDFDPCPINPTFNGLEVEWGQRNFINPPYKTMLAWIKKGFEEYQKGKLSVFLLPVRTETKYFHELILPNAKIRFVRGKLKFGAPDSKLPESEWCPAPFASMLVIFNPNKNEGVKDDGVFETQTFQVCPTEPIISGNRLTAVRPNFLQTIIIHR